MFLSQKVSIQKVSSKISILLLLAIATGLFAACNNSNIANNNLPKRQVDTAKVTPTPATSSIGLPSPVSDLSKLPELEIGELEAYKHRSGLLEMSVPKNWQLIDNSQIGELLVTWNEKAGRATISVNIFVPPSEIPESRLADIFAVIIKGMYGNQSDFSMRSPVIEETGNIMIEWTSSVTMGNKKVKFQANSKLQRTNNKLAILTFGAIEPKFMEMKDSFVKISNSQIVNGSLSIP